MVGNEKKIPIAIGKTLRQFVIKIATGLCFAQIPTAFICKSMLEKTIYILTRKVTAAYVGICGASGVFKGYEARKYTAFKGDTAHVFMLDHILAYQ